jgi:hypothetical protein
LLVSSPQQLFQQSLQSNNNGYFGKYTLSIVGVAIGLLVGVHRFIKEEIRDVKKDIKDMEERLNTRLSESEKRGLDQYTSLMEAIHHSRSSHEHTDKEEGI